MPHTIDEIVQPHTIVTVDDNDTVLENHSLAIDQGRIIDIDNNDAIANRYQAKTKTVLPDHVVMPGLINCHTHAAMSLLRGYADDLPLMEWLNNHIWPAEAKHVNEAFVQVGTELAIAEMLKSGTTCFNDMYFFPNMVAQCVEKTSIRASIGMITLNFPTVWANNADEYLSKGLAVKDAFRHSNLISWAFAPHAPYTASDSALQRIATLAEELDCRIHIHIHETADEIKTSIEQHGMRPLQRLSQLNLLSPRLQAVHMTQLTNEEIRLLAEHNVSVIHCPESNMKLASGFCPVKSLTDADINIAIGTDGASSNNDLDMFGEMRMASLLAKGYSADPTALSAVQTIRCATINGAKALALDDEIGSLEKNKQADMIAIDLHSFSNTQPTYHPCSQIVYSAGREQVSHSWVAGKKLLDDGRLTTIDEQQLVDQVNNWKQAIQTT